MQTLLVVNNPKNWPLDISGVEVVSAKTYLTDVRFSEGRRIRIFNLCRSYRYQTMGYYVSLLAAARGHRPIPGISTIQDMKSQTMVRFISDDLDDLIQRSLSQIKTSKYSLNVYFGKSMVKRHDKLAAKLFYIIHTPLLRADFVFQKKKWILQNVSPIAMKEIPDEHRYFIMEAANEYIGKGKGESTRKSTTRFDMAILHNEEEKTPPSGERAIRKFIKAAASVGIAAEVIRKEDYSRIAEFDALLIRETTAVNHHTYRFSRRAAAEGLVVIDDPQSILKCTNKVFLAELLQRHRIPAPKTMIMHRENVEKVAVEIGFPCILKQPDSSFSQGVTKVKNEAELKLRAEELLDKSDLVIAQKFIPTDFDWRIGILDKRLLFACKYFMAPGHWQIYNYEKKKLQEKEGTAQAVSLEDVPPRVLKTALKAANLIGDGLYGVDIKEVGKRVYVIEINDNPNIDVGCEDDVIKNELYMEVMRVFLQRIEKRKAAGAGK